MASLHPHSTLQTLFMHCSSLKNLSSEVSEEFCNVAAAVIMDKNLMACTDCTRQ